MESRTQPSRPSTQKNPRPRLRTDFLRPRPRTQSAIVLPPKKKFPKNFFRRAPEKKKLLPNFPRGFCRFPKSSKKKGHVHGSFLTKQKKCCPQAEDRTFSTTCGLQGQGLKSVSLRLRTSLRTPFLPLTEVKK